MVAGVRMRAPMMRIHTVAAGGGSILQLRRHAASASAPTPPAPIPARPAIAAAGRSPSPTPTCCSAASSRRTSPRVFGPNGDQPLDAGIVQRKFAALAEEIAAATGDAHGPEEVADGFLKIAVENMANAIKQISVQRGYDVTEYVLNCFGGAGGQHACRIADALGMTRVLIHPLAGVLSAYGMGLRRSARAARAARSEACSSERLCPSSRERLDALAAGARAEMRRQGDRRRAACESSGSAHLRYQGTDTPLDRPVRPAGGDDARRSRTLHRQRFGFLDAGPPARRRSSSPPRRSAPPTAGDATCRSRTANAAAAARPSTCTSGSSGGWRDAPVRDRAGLAPGDAVDGPAIIVEANAHDCRRARLARRGSSARRDLILEPRPAAARRPGRSAPTADPVMLEVFNNLFMSIAEQMGVALAEHRAVGQHQGAARFLLRRVRPRRRPGRQRAAHAGAPGLDGREHRDGHPRATPARCGRATSTCSTHPTTAARTCPTSP